MGKLSFVLALFVVVAATGINGQYWYISFKQIDNNHFVKFSLLCALGEAESLKISFPPLVEPLTPSDVPITPKFLHAAPSQPRTPKGQINGRLLTPAEGCGHSPLGNNRIVGGGPAKNGAWPWMVLLGYRGRKHCYFCC